MLKPYSMPQKDLGTQSNRVVDGERANNQARNLHSLIFPPNRVLLLELQTDVVNLLLIEIIDLAFPGAWLALVFAYRELLAPHGPHCVRGQVCVATTRSHVTLSEALPISYRRCHTDQTVLDSPLWLGHEQLAGLLLASQLDYF